MKFPHKQVDISQFGAREILSSSHYFFFQRKFFLQYPIHDSYLFHTEKKCGFYRWVTPLRAIFCESITLDSRGRVIASKLPNVSNVHKFTKAYGSLDLLEICDSSSSNRELWLIRCSMALGQSEHRRSQYGSCSHWLPLFEGLLSWLVNPTTGLFWLVPLKECLPSKRVIVVKYPQIEFLYISNSNYEIHIHYLTNTQTVYFIFTNFIHVFCK